MRLGPDGRLDLHDPALRLTDEQRSALAIDREIVLTAGAGAGKTHTLALRWAMLMLELCHAGDADVDSVLVLTFTERAAEEMAERCYRHLTELAAAAHRDHPGPLADALFRLLDRFDAAAIHTFHGFCASILQRFPSETRTPVGGGVSWTDRTPGG